MFFGGGIAIFGELATFGIYQRRGGRGRYFRKLTLRLRKICRPALLFLRAA